VWNFGPVTPYFGYLLRGLIVTLELTVVSSIATIILATILAILRLCPLRPLRVFAYIYVDIFRSIPQLVLLVFTYFVIGPFAGKHGVSVFWLAAAALTLSSAGYQTEVYRAALESVPRPQWDAALSLGFSWFEALVRVILPQAVRSAIPPTMNLIIYLIKGTSLAGLITVSELVQHANVVIAETFLPFPTYILVAAIYVVVVLPLVVASRFIERRIERGAKNAQAEAASTASGAASVAALME
jgi:His/Glu/Gln/Arg/opine family amino acid ABC transporter permease subunit